MSFESLGDLLAHKNIDQADDLMAFFEQVRKVIRAQAHVEVESIRYKNNIVGVTAGSSLEASEIRLRHIQIERTLRKITGRTITRVTVRVGG